MEAFIQQYGYLAILIGTFLEGETVLILGGFAAYSGYLELPWVIVAAGAGAVIGDQLCFFLGRTSSEPVLQRLSSWRPRVERVRAWIERYQIAVVIGYRFLYGFRSVTPFVLGMSGFSPSRFIPLNLLSAGIWALSVGVLGYSFGTALRLFLDDLKRYQGWILLAGLAIGLSIAVINRLRKRLQRPKQPAP